MSLTAKDKNIVTIGRGKLGQSLTQLFKLLGYKVSNVGRSLPNQLSAIRQADIVFLCVDDDSIENVCRQLAPDFPEKCVVSHCSGALDRSVLQSAQDQGCRIASTHPLNTFPNLESSLALFSSLDHGSYLYAEGDKKALATLMPLFDSAGFVSLRIEREAKPLYHAACVFACNYLTSLMSMSLESAAAAGLDKDQFWASLQPLIRSTLENISDKGITESLSGPIARGDHSTVESHIQALGELSSSLKNNYANLGLRALEIAIEKEGLSDEHINSLRTILEQAN